MFAVSRTIANTILMVGLLSPCIAQADIDACFNFLDAQDYARAESEARQILQDDNINRTDERAAQLCLGRAYDSMGRTQDALPAFLRTEALSQSTKELATAYNWLAGCYLDMNDLDRAELYFQRSLRALRALGDKKDEEATTLNNLGGVALYRGDTERAIKLYREALPMQPEAEQASSLGNIAAIHSTRKEYKQAIKLLRKAIDIDRRNGDTHATAIHQINLGENLKYNKQYPTAEKELLAGLNTIRLVGDKKWEATACRALGMLAITNGNPKKNVDEAIQWMEKAVALYREIGDIASADEIVNLLTGK